MQASSCTMRPFASICALCACAGEHSAALRACGCKLCLAERLRWIGPSSIERGPSPAQMSTSRRLSMRAAAYPPFMPPIIREISDPDALSMAAQARDAS